MRLPMVLAFYLPQYHCIPENDEWWGKGFTEWKNVKQAKPLYKGHMQPRIPFNDNYYNLLDYNSIRWQAEIAKEYRVDGFCIYHYWFKGKKLLEKPLEILLGAQDIDISYCISWANETWSRRWTGEERNILIKQEYGAKDEWKEHLVYLINFFKDKRYIRINNRPVLFIYRAFDIPNYEAMIDFWNKEIKKYGFEGIYIIETLNSSQKKRQSTHSQAVAEFEPMYTLYNSKNYLLRLYRYIFKRLNSGLIDKINYNKIYKQIIQRNYKENNNFFGAFPSWDNSPRKGKFGTIFKNASPENFEKFFSMQYKYSVQKRNEIITINAWNEWGEGAYLEPDVANRYKYLEVIKRVVERYGGKN